MTPPVKKSPSPKKTTRQTPAARDRRVLELRGKGKTFQAIAKQLRFRDVAAVHAAYERALTVRMPETPDRVRRAQLDLVTVQELKLWPKAESGDLAAITGLVELVLERQRIQAAPAPLESKRQPGPIETATKQEADRLADVAPALAATALVLARVVDDHTDEPGHTATAARELRMHMSQLRGLAGTRPPPQRQETTPPDDGQDKDQDKDKATGTEGKDAAKEATVDELEALRQRAEATTVDELEALRQRAAERARERTSH